MTIKKIRCKTCNHPSNAIKFPGMHQIQYEQRNHNNVLLTKSYASAKVLYHYVYHSRFTQYPLQIDHCTRIVLRRNVNNANNSAVGGHPTLMRVYSCSMARIGQLAASKHAPQQYKPPRPPQTQVSVESMKASLSPRVDDLSNPRAKQLGPFRDPIWEVRMTYLVSRTSNILGLCLGWKGQ